MSSELKLPKIVYKETMLTPQMCVNKQSDRHMRELHKYVVDAFSELHDKICESNQTLENNSNILKCSMNNNTRDFASEMKKITTDFSVKFDKLNQPLKNINNKCDAIANIYNAVCSLLDEQRAQSQLLMTLEASMRDITEKIIDIDARVEHVKNKLSEYDIEEIVSDADTLDDV